MLGSQSDACFQAEQHKNLVFVGPGGTGKTYLSRKLAESIQVGALATVLLNCLNVCVGSCAIGVP